ncbi:CHAT domain-containing protein [Streptomyces sp. NPDC051636]|uniref:CHAT domain-containing protein n=1 Tax=Streptomyces sp. NPDC051636 TaxID=3365663 RepID=UPI003787470C
MSALDDIATAWKQCQTGDVSGCLRRLRRLPTPATLDPATRAGLDRVIDDIAAVLPLRLRSAAGIGCEAACLDLLHAMSDRDLLPGVVEYESLGAALMQGLRAPLDESDLPAKLVAHARSLMTGPSHSDGGSVHSWENSLHALGEFVTAFRPRRRPGHAGSTITRVLSVTARAFIGGYDQASYATWLGQGIRLLANETISEGSHLRARAHLIYHRLIIDFHSARLREDHDACRKALDTLGKVGLACGRAGLVEESWALSARVAFLAGYIPWDSPQTPVSMIVDAQIALRDCGNPRVALLEDIINSAALPHGDGQPSLKESARRCWASVRDTLASLGAPIPAASRWRAANAMISVLGDLPLLSLLDDVRHNQPQQWASAMLPTFFAHPYEWRDTDTGAPGSTHPVRGVSMTGEGHIWHVNTDAAFTSVAHSKELNSALWQSPRAWGAIVGPDNISDALVQNLESYATAGLFPVIRMFNIVTRTEVNPIGFGGTEREFAQLVDLASRRLENVYEGLAGHSLLHARPDEMICTVGPLTQIPWELAWDRGTGSANVCLDPRSTGFDAVRIPAVVIGPDTRVAVFVDSESLDRARHELAGIEATLGAASVERHTDFAADRIAKAAATCDVLHFITHGEQAWSDARKNAIDPDGRRVTAEQIARLDLSRVQLVVLNACDAAAPGPRSLAGDPTFVGAFLAAGSKAIIANLWSVEDRLAEAFSSALYRELTTGRSLTDAFGRARRRMRTEAETLMASLNATGSAAFLADPFKLTLRGLGVTTATQ